MSAGGPSCRVSQDSTGGRGSGLLAVNCGSYCGTVYEVVVGSLCTGWSMVKDEEARGMWLGNGGGSYGGEDNCSCQIRFTRCVGTGDWKRD